MKKVLNLAAKGKGRTNPNPMVGALLVKNKRIVGKGYHKKAGLPHAEIEAIRSAEKKAIGGSLFVNLEPCSHYGKTGPCSEAIIKSKIKEVIIGMKDPNPLVSGKGIRRLERAGIKVIQGIMERECRKLNESFIKYISSKRPYVTMKAAMSLDGKISTTTGESKWITGDKARKYVHKMRDETDAIVVGINTVLRDDPSLTTRIENKYDLKNPLRIVLDSSLKIPMKANLIKSKNNGRTIVATTNKASKNKIKLLEDRGIMVLRVKEKNCRVDMNDLMKKLGKMEITSLIIEGGAEVNASALQSKVVDKVVFFIAPIIIGGANATSSIMGKGIELLKDAVTVNETRIRKIGPDFMCEGYINRY